jgi:iron complex outermembrane receptor protein
MKRFFTLIASVIAFYISVNAQEIEGYVYDLNRNPLSDVNIVVTGTNEGTVSNKNGYFSLNYKWAGKITLEFSSIGYKTVIKEIQNGKNSNRRIEVLMEPEVYFTDEILIGAQKDPEQEVLDIPVRTKTLGLQEINASPAISSHKLLEGISGVNVNAEAGMFSSTEISMRGLGGNTKGGTLIVLDGSPLNKSDAGSVNWSLIDKDNIATLEVIKGPGSAIFGSNAMGGIINITTRKPVERFSASLSSSYGTYNTFDSKLRLSGVSENKKLYWRSFAMYRNSDGYINTPDEVILENDSIVVPVFLEEYSISGLAGYYFNDKNNAEVSLSYTDDTKGRGVKIYEFYGANTNRSTVHGFAKYRGKFGNFNVFANVFVLNEDYFRLNEYYSDGEYALYEIKSGRLESGAKAFAQYFVNEKIDITAGAEYKAGAVDGADIYYTSTDVIRNRGNLDIFSGFVQLKYLSKNSKLTVVPGLRYDLAIFRNALFSIENPSYSIEYLSEFQFVQQNPANWSSFSPKLVVEYKLTKPITVYAVAAKGFRAPVLDDLCRSDQVRTGFRVTNPNIRAEYLYSFETGADFVSEFGLDAGISVYYNIGKDFMYLISTGDSVNMGYTIAPIYQTSNIGEVNIYGLEADISYKVNKNIRLFSNYTNNTSVISSFIVNPDGAGIDLTGKFLTDIADHKAAGGASFVNNILNVSATFNYNGSRWIKDDNSFENVYFMSDKYPAYTTFDLRFWKSYRGFDASITIDNVTNKIYTNSKGYKCPGRMFIFELKYNFTSKNKN